MANSALGSALTIPQSALDAIERADKKLKDIQDTAKNTATSVTKSFDSMAIGTKPFLDTLDQVINKLNIVGASATNASGGLNNIGASAGTMSGNITQASMNVQNMVAQLSKMNGSGTSGIMQAVLAFQRLQEATKGASGMNIAELKQEIGAIDSMLKDVDYNLTKTDQDSLIKRKKMLQDELKYQQQMYEERAVAFQKALDKMVSAEQSYNNKQRKIYADRAKDYQTRNNKTNTTYQGALDFSASANTLNRQVRAIEYLKEARMKLSTADADYKHKLDTLNAAIAQHTKNLKEAEVNTKQLGEQTSYMSGYISRWAQRMAFAFSINSIKGFVGQVAEVRGQFELSQRSLEAILQNKPKADEIFNKTVELAVKSPFRIKDLVDYTRQLSAYRIESDKLYDTTKRLADVSAGLGVDMGRLILAYGQVKAAAYLRGSEVRQFTEAGVNMYGELQEYFKEVKGEAYTTAQIVDMISKRKVTFEDVEAIFQRMTDKGGTFYNMQAIQAETLQGKISNLKDAFDVMLNDIGKANEGTFKGMISSVTELLHSWKSIVNVAKIFAGFLVSIYVTTKLTNGAWGQTAANIMASHKRLGVFKALMAALTGDTAKLGSTFTTLGNTIKASLPLAALTAVIALVQELISVNNEYKESMAKNTKEYYTAQVRVEEIDAEAKTNNQKALQDLVKEMNQKGFGVTIGVNISEEEAKNQYDILLKDYKEFLDNMRAIDAKYEANKKKGWLMGDDDIETDMQEYTSSMGEFLQKGDDIRSILAQVSKESVNLTDSQKEMFKQLAAGPQEGQSLLDYYAKVAKALKEIGYIQSGWFGSKQNMVGILGGTGNNGYDWGIGANADEQLSKFALTYETYIKNLEEVRKEAQSVFGDVSKYKDEASKKKLQIQIDNEALKRGWGDIERDMLYKTYNIKINIDKNNTQKEVSWVDDFISRFFAEKKYGISLVVKEIDDDKAFEGFLGKGDQAAKAAKNWKEVEKRLAAVRKNQKEIKIDDSIRNIFKAGEIPLGQKTISVDTVRKKVKAYKEAAIKEAKSLGVDPFEKQNNKLSKQRAKAQRDILQERISLLKDMNSKYNELIKTESKETALSATRKYFKEAAQNVGWKASDILPDDASVAKRIREIGSQYKELTKRGNAFRISADIDLKVSEKEYNKLKDDISRNVNDAFSQMDLYKKLKDEGMSDELIKSMFGDLTKSFDEVQEDINNEFNKYIIKDYETHYGKDFTKWGDKVIQQYNSDLENTAEVIRKKFSGSDVEKEYLNQTQKLNQKIEQDTTDTAQKLFKEYKQRLSDQLQLDRKYIADRIAIMKNFSDPETQKKLLDNIDLDYKKKTGENTWKDFKNSDMYVRLFDNLDQVSSKALDAMAERLQQLRTELRDLDPTELKTIAEQINKVNEVRNSRNPFKAFTSGLKEMIKAGKDLKKSGGVEKYVELNGLRADLTSKLQNQNAYVESLEHEYNELAKINGADESVVAALKLKLATNKSIRDSLKSQLNLTDEQITKLGTIMTEEEQAKAKFSKSVTDITSVVSTMATAFNGLFEALGGSDEQLENTLSVVDNIGQAIGSYYSGNYAGVVSGAMGALTGVAKLFSNEGKIDKEIARQERAVNSLQHAYEKLKKSMDDAFDTQKLYEYNQKSVDALKKQQKAYQAMINAERGRKKPDEGKIQEWEQQIDDLNTTIQELGESMTEALGGFGSQSNYKSAAEAFSEAWVDAFNEGSDGLEALNDKFNEYFNNLLKKQLMARAAAKFIQPILDAVDAAVAKGSEGGNDGLEVTSGELEKLQELKNTNLQAFNEYANTLMKVLGVTSKGASNLSNLQQGIQSVSEATAQSLESIINSIRYFLAQQQSDVAAIRNILEVRLGAVTAQGESGGSSNQMIALMEQQAGYLHEICDNWSSVLKGGHKQGGKGIKVFMS